MSVPVTVFQAQRDKFIRPAHARYIADTVPGARYLKLEGVSHFAPVQRPAVFNAAMIAFLGGLSGTEISGAGPWR